MKYNHKKGIRFFTKELELTRKWGLRQESIPLIHKYLSIRPGIKIIDVGCGTGFFTRLISNGMRGNGTIIGVDRNSELLRAARNFIRTSDVKKKNLHISFRKGDVYKLPFPDNYADRVLCHALLWMVSERKHAIAEMIRVCKPGGLVGIIEGGVQTAICYYPDDPVLSKLDLHRIKADARGYQKLYGYDRGIGYKIPMMFHELGLARIRLDGIVNPIVQCDDRIPIDEKIALYKYLIKEINLTLDGIMNSKKNTTNVSSLGGMPRRMQIEFLKRKSVYLQRLVDNPDLISQNTSVNIETITSTNAGIRFITTGMKLK